MSQVLPTLDDRTKTQNVKGRSVSVTRIILKQKL